VCVSEKNESLLKQLEDGRLSQLERDRDSTKKMENLER